MLTVSMLNEVEQALAARGDVIIVGRGGFRVLQGSPQVLHVRVVAPWEVRAQRVAKRSDIALAVATTRVQTDDAARERFVKLFYNADVTDPAGYELELDTSAMTAEDAAAAIVERVRALPAATGDQPASEVDPVLADAVSKALK